MSTTGTTVSSQDVMFILDSFDVGAIFAVLYLNLKQYSQRSLRAIEHIGLMKLAIKVGLSGCVEV